MSRTSDGSAHWFGLLSRARDISGRESRESKIESKIESKKD